MKKLFTLIVLTLITNLPAQSSERNAEMDYGTDRTSYYIASSSLTRKNTQYNSEQENTPSKYKEIYKEHNFSPEEQRYFENQVETEKTFSKWFDIICCCCLCPNFFNTPEQMAIVATYKKFRPQPNTSVYEDDEDYSWGFD